MYDKEQMETTVNGAVVREIHTIQKETPTLY